MKRISNTLVTLSAAAIVAVYAAGFHRTRAAADEFQAQAARARRRAAPAIAVPITATAVPLSAAQPAAQSPPAVAITTPPPASPVSAPRSDRATAPPQRVRDSRSTTERPAAATAAPSPASPAPPALASNDAPQPQLAASLSAPPAITEGAPQADTSAPPASVPVNPAAPRGTPAAAAAKFYYEDGTYRGRGRSAHGDLEISVVIRNGKIVSTVISDCETAYPCSWIAALPGQVVSRQNASIDVVSGASDSSYAFQDAVSAALFMARRGG